MTNLDRTTQDVNNEYEPFLETGEKWGNVVGLKKALFTVTFLENQSAQTSVTKQITLGQLRHYILTAQKASKDELPWLKLASFGSKRSDNNCLRHNANVLSISGIELDYDTKVMKLDEAIGIAKQARLLALFYTSANYSDATPKWRILLPTSKSLPPGERAKLVARVNGLYGGIFAQESFTLSQAYYFGSVNHNPEHRAVITEGDFIDLREDLDAGAINKTGTIGQSDDDAVGSDPNDPFGNLANELLKPKWTPANEDRIWKALCCIPANLLRPQWVEIGMVLHWLHWVDDDGYDWGLEAWDKWSQTSDGEGPGERGGDYKGRDDIERRWASFGGEKQKLVTTKRLFDIARKYGWKEDTEELDGEEKQTKKGKPVIEIRGGQLPVLATEAEKVLLENGVEIYQRGNVLVRPVIEEVDAAHGRKTKIARFVEIADVYLCDVLGRLIMWKRFDVRAKKWVNTDTPPKVASTLLARDGEWKFPKVAGVISTPTLRPDGTIIDQEGYDAVTRLLLLAPPPMPPIPDKPTKNDALRALALLEDLLVEFPFVGDVDRSVALSGFITPVVRGAFPVAPMHAANAPVAGTGKSYLFDCVAAIATGRLMPVMAAGRNEEETEKRLGAAIMTGQALIDVDNVNGEIGGDALCQLLERPIVDVRVLGESRQVRVEARGTSVFCTDNNIVVSDDLVRRVIKTNLDPKVERPELREFKGDPTAKILADRGAYIAACLTICRAYIVAGQPDKAKRLASYEGWSDIVRSALIWLGKADPVDSIETMHADDPKVQRLRDVLLAWADTIGIGSGARMTLQAVFKLVDERKESGGFGSIYASEPKYPELHSAIQAVASWNRRPADEKSFGNWARRNKDRYLDGLRLRVEADPKGKSKWWLESSSGKQKAGKAGEKKKTGSGEQKTDEQKAGKAGEKKAGERQHGRGASFK